jgi:hypothetical protein
MNSSSPADALLQHTLLRMSKQRNKSIWKKIACGHKFERSAFQSQATDVKDSSWRETRTILRMPYMWHIRWESSLSYAWNAILHSKCYIEYHVERMSFVQLAVECPDCVRLEDFTPVTMKNAILLLLPLSPSQGRSLRAGPSSGTKTFKCTVSLLSVSAPWSMATFSRSTCALVSLILKLSPSSSFSSAVANSYTMLVAPGIEPETSGTVAGRSYH